ncbi:hypothetical protein [Lacihabitans lacunae]|uniref:DUF5723 domain-containing protein n=1 Tax=Lacihabitans lacunae TaxID=1028214 RepID=A0ABV7YZH6_9BACT
MKKLILFLSIPFSLHAQSDSLNVTFSEEKVEVFEKTTLIDEYEKAFGGNREVKSGLRVRFVSGSFSKRSNTFLQYEQKFGDAFSIIGSVNAGFQPNTKFQLNSEIEGRWYFLMKKDIELKSKKGNITGDFISFKFSTPDNNSSLLNRTNLIGLFGSFSRYYERTYSIIYGRQFANVFEFGLIGGFKTIKSNKRYEYSNFYDTHNKVYLTTHSQVGLGLLFPKTKDLKNSCEFLKCNYEVNRLLKFNLNNIFYLDRNYQALSANGSYEQRIFNSRFTTNSGGLFGFSREKEYRYNNYDPNSGIFIVPTKIEVKRSFFSTSFHQQLRYYLPKIKANYNGVKNLNGLYIAAEGTVSKTIISDFNKPLNSNKVGVSLGYQTLATKNTFLDVFASFNRFNSQSLLYGNNESYKEKGNMLNAGIKLGLAK